MKNLFFLILAVSALMLSCNGGSYKSEASSEANTYYSVDDFEDEVAKEIALANGSVTSGLVASNSGGLTFAAMDSNGEKDLSTINQGVNGKKSDDSKTPKSAKRKLIKTGSIAFETEALADTDAQVRNLIEQYEGYISYETLDNYHSSLDQSITVRLPSDKFDLFINALQGKVGSFDSKQINVQDVTEEYVDVVSRLKTKYEMEVNYLALLKKAKNVGDMLEVERELGYIRTEIESMEGRLRYLDDRSDFSTITLNFYEYKDAKVVNFFGEVGQNFQSGWRGLKNFTLGLISAWPFLIILSIAFWFIRKWWIKRKAKA